MIIVCINCSKKFEVNSELIPAEGRTIQCGSCDHIWFFKKDLNNDINNDADLQPSNLDPIIETNNKDKDLSLRKNEKDPHEKSKPNIANLKKKISQKKTFFSLSRFLSFILVIIVTFIGILLIIDTFDSILFRLFPKLEFFVFSFYETIKDIVLFFKDLI